MDDRTTIAAMLAAGMLNKTCFGGAGRTSAPSASPVESLEGAHVRRSCW